MPRTKVFLILILILLLVNAIFFVSWYGLGGRNLFRKTVAEQLGRLMKGKLSIGELQFSDRQLFAENISFTSADSTITVDVSRLRVQYNLLRFIFSGFKVKGLIREADVYKPVVAYRYRYKPSVPRPKKPLILPDLAGYFKSLSVRDGNFRLDMQLPLKIIQDGQLLILEEVHNIDITVQNRNITTLKLTAESSSRGRISLEGILNRGRIASAELEATGLNPRGVSHPDLKQLSTEASLVAFAKQDSLGAKLSYEAKAQLWGTSALFNDKYPVRIPYLSAETDGQNLSAQFSRSSFGSSYASAEVQISDLGPKLNFKIAKAEAGLDLGMIMPDLKGFVQAQIDAGGTLKEPYGNIALKSDYVAWQKYSLQNLNFSSFFKEGVLNFENPGLRFENHLVNLSGALNPTTLSLDANLETSPLLTSGQPYLVTADLDLHAQLLSKFPLVEAKINRIDASSGLANLNGVSGSVNLIPALDSKNYYVDASLTGEDGVSLKLIGDILDRNLLLDANFSSLSPAAVYAHKQLQKLDPLVSGNIKAILNGDKITTHSELSVALRGFLPYTTKLDLLGNFDLNKLEGTLHLMGREGLLNEQELSFNLAAALQNNQLQLYGLRVNDLISLSGRMNLQNYKDNDFSLALWNISYLDIVRFYPDLDVQIPEFKGLTLFAEYNKNQDKAVVASLNLNEIDLLAVTPLGLNLSFNGPLQNIKLQGVIDGPSQKILDLNGNLSLDSRIDLALEAAFKDLAIENVVLDSPLSGILNGKAGIVLKDLMGKPLHMDLMADLRARHLKFGDFVLDTVMLKAVQNRRLLQVDNLYVFSDQLFELTGSGAIDYNAVNNEFFEGQNRLNLQIDGQLFSWLKNITPYIQESRGNSSLSCSIGIQDEQFLVSGGKLDISDGFMRIKDQTEPLSNIFVRGTFDKNRIIIERGQVQMGEGKLVFNNIFEADNSDHFMLGFMDLGIIRLLIEEPGILANVPLFTPPKTLSNILLKGRNSRYAMVKGPFDQMKISAEVQLSNTSALFPPNTDNLLKLANSVREATNKRSDSDTAPLPFSLDALITLGENVSYVTYPAKLSIQPGGYLHLLYDGLAFTVQDAYFSSERGTIDIFGTVFQVEKVDITMVDAQDLLNVDGIFYKRAPDGTLITLKATTLPDLSKSFMDRLQFSLTSDNPEDRSISQILSRLRYSGSSDPNRQDSGVGLQDEALNLISGNLDASLYTPFLSPVETYVRRKLKLDNFTINAGFLQNLYTQYSNDPSQLFNYADMKQLTTDIAQFSSSILLNNLSISLSKYLGRRFFWDYQLELQEATDLQKRTRIMISHETSLRLMLPRQYRLGYTFQYTPQDKKTSHEIMIQRSFRFWGL